MSESFAKGGKLLIAGNGGSAADAGHIAGEMMKNLVKKRKLDEACISNIKETDGEIAGYLISHLQPGLPAIDLSSQASIITAAINDIDSNIIFTQQVYSYGKEGDVFLGISTSGNAKNVLYAAAAAKAKQLRVIALSGGSGGALRRFADVSIIVPETETYKIQELHLPIYHCLCLMIEERFF
jgi:D-sedoheptulose 7-phosphate isomerase